MPTRYRRVVHVETGRTLVGRAKWCDTFASRLRGFTFRRKLPVGSGLVLVERKESRVNTAIHMLFVFFDLGVVWVNEAGQIVDAVRAQPWRLSYTPQAPARYTLEAHPDILTQVRVGDQIRFEALPGETL